MRFPELGNQVYHNGEKAGFDEMFPTINECLYPDYPWKGAEMPDHGEVWALPWSCKIEKEAVSLQVNGVRLPYRLSKKLILDGFMMKVVYSVENLSLFPMPFLYAAHPLFNITAGDRIIVPDNLKTIINASGSDRLPEYGKEYTWSKDDLAIVPIKNTSGHQKYYFKQENVEGWSVLHRGQAGFEIKMLATAEKLSYLGVWVNEGGWDNQYNLALEPASASMDDLLAARKWGRESILEPSEVYEWTLDLTVQKI